MHNIETHINSQSRYCGRFLEGRYGLRGPSEKLDDLLQYLCEEYYGHYAPDEGGRHKKRAYAAPLLKELRKMAEAAQAISAIREESFSRILQVACVDFVGSPADLVREAVDAFANWKERDCPFDPDDELEQELLQALTSHWFEHGGERDRDKIAMFALDALRGRSRLFDQYEGAVARLAQRLHLPKVSEDELAF